MEFPSASFRVTLTEVPRASLELGPKTRETHLSSPGCSKRFCNGHGSCAILVESKESKHARSRRPSDGESNCPDLSGGRCKRITSGSNGSAIVEIIGSSEAACCDTLGSRRRSCCPTHDGAEVAKLFLSRDDCAKIMACWRRFSCRRRRGRSRKPSIACSSRTTRSRKDP